MPYLTSNADHPNELVFYILIGQTRTSSFDWNQVCLFMLKYYHDMYFHRMIWKYKYKLAAKNNFAFSKWLYLISSLVGVTPAELIAHKLKIVWSV